MKTFTEILTEAKKTIEMSDMDKWWTKDKKYKDFCKDVNTISPVDTPFKVGDTVIWKTRGANYSGLKVIGFVDTVDDVSHNGGKFIYVDSQSFWAPVSPKELKIVKK